MAVRSCCNPTRDVDRRLPPALLKLAQQAQSRRFRATQSNDLKGMYEDGDVSVLSSSGPTRPASAQQHITIANKLYD
jgi:hypothetical protein